MPDSTTGLNMHRSEAIFAVRDVPAAVKYYRDVLGFECEWRWGEPPTFGGIRFGKIGIMFCLQPELAAKIEGHQHAFMLTGVDALHKKHAANGAEIVEPLESKPWGLREYTVRDLNGYWLRFGEHSDPHAGKSSEALDGSSHIRIIERGLTLEEFTRLNHAVKWTQYTHFEAVPAALKNTIYAVVAMDGETAIGAARIIGDGSTFYIQDVMVHPDYQRKRIGTAMMDKLMQYLQRHAPPLSFIGLFTGRNLGAFYERWGFQGPETYLYGMSVRKRSVPLPRTEL